MRLANTGRACLPKVRPNSMRAWCLDELSTGSATDVVGGLSATVFGVSPGPFVQDGPSGKSRVFGALASNLRAALVATDQPRMLGDWTVAALVRMDSTPGGTVTPFAYAGSIGDAPADPQNYMMAMQVTSTRAPQMFWENGAGTNVTTVATTYRLPVGKWTLIHWVKSSTTAPGPGGTCSLALFINGELIEKFSGVQNTSDGGAAVWRIGGEENGGAAVGVWPGAIDGVHAWAGALTADDVAEDMRRVRRLPFFTRSDLRVEVARSDGVGINLCDLEGTDFVDSVSVTDEVDQPCTTARVDLMREVGTVSLSVLNTQSKLNLSDVLNPASYAPFILEGRAIEVFTARVPLGCTATGKDWESTFKGFIDDVEEGGEKITLQCRDLGALLVDTYIEETIPYGSDTIPAAVEGEMQFILNDNDSDTFNNSIAGLVARPGSYLPITLYTPVTPSWAVKRWKQRRESVLAALRTLAGQIGWECRYRFDRATDTWRLHFFDPERDRIDADVLLKPDEFQDISRFSRSILGNRNVVRVVYPSSETVLPGVPALPPGYISRSGWNNTDGQNQRMTAFVEIESTVSIALYNRRLFAEMGESSSSQVDTVNEAFLMCYGALRDMEEGKLTAAMTLQFMPEMELNDIVVLDVNPVLHTAQQRLAVRSLTHTFAEQSTTSVELRGRPSVGWKRWLRLETRAGNGRPGVVSPADANADLTQGSLLEVVRNIQDRSGLVRGGKFTVVRNSSFDQFTNGKQNLPDAWTLDTPNLAPSGAAWGSTSDFFWTVESITSSTSLVLRGTGPLAGLGLLRSDFIPITGDIHVSYSLQVTWLRKNPGGATGNGLRVRIEYYDANRVFIAGIPVADFTNNGSLVTETWFTERVDGIPVPRFPSSSAAFARLVVSQVTGFGAATNVLLDTINYFRTANQLTQQRLANQAPTVPVAGSDHWNCIRWDQNDFDSTARGALPAIQATPNTFPGTGRGFLCYENGVYQVKAHVTFDSNNVNRSGVLRLMKNATYDVLGNYVTGTGVVLAQGDMGALQAKAIAGYFGAGVRTYAGYASLVADVDVSKNDIVTVQWHSRFDDVRVIGQAAGVTAGSYWTIKLKLAE